MVKSFLENSPKRGVFRMWTVVYMAQSKEIATALQELLTKEGILVKLRPISKNHENNDNYYEVLVPEAEVEEAHSVIIEKGY
jgi:hypothetical protein